MHSILVPLVIFYSFLLIVYCGDSFFPLSSYDNNIVNYHIINLRIFQNNWLYYICCGEQQCVPTKRIVF